MIVRLKASALKESNWYEHALRFGLGGLATVFAGVVAKIDGPAAGGLFLAFSGDPLRQCHLDREA
jgi:hypothetical protein